MKRILPILVALAFSVTAFAQSYDNKTLLSAAKQPASTATNRSLIIDCGKQSSVALQIEVMNDATGAATLTFPITRSVDGATYATSLDGLAIAFNGVTKQTVVTNIPTYGALTMKIPYTTNSHATINCTNLVIKYGQKTQAN